MSAAQLVVDYTPPSPNLNQLITAGGMITVVNQPATRWMHTTAPTTGTSVSSRNITHTLSGTNRLLLVAVSLGASGGSYAVRTVSSVSAGTGLTRVGLRTNYFACSCRTEIWSLVAPDTATNGTVVVYFSGAMGTYQQAIVGVMSFTGVDQTTPLNTVAEHASYTGTASVTMTSASGELGFLSGGLYGPNFD